MNTVNPAIIIALVLEGCSSTFAVLPEKGSKASSISYERLNAVLSESLSKDFRVILTDAREYDARELVVRRDSTRFYDDYKQVFYLIATGDVLRIEIRD